MIRRTVRIVIIPLVVAFITFGFSFRKNTESLSQYSLNGTEFCYYVPTENERSLKTTEIFFSPILGKSYVGFKEALGFKESRGNYFTVNEYGYLGKYQFGRSTLQVIGVYNTIEFLNNPILQEEAFSANTSRNKWVLRRDIKRYVGRTIGGIKITESGILAAAHLAGPGNVKKYLRSGGVNNFNDAFGTSIRYYMKKFSGYDTSYIVANKKAKVI